MGKIKFYITIAMLLGIVFSLSSCSYNIDTPQKSIFKKGNFIIIEGKWVSTTEKIQNIIPRINCVNLVCNRETMTCEETEALLWSPNENPIHKGSLLYTNTFVYEITDWTSEDTIIAKREPPVADVEIKISLKDNHAEKSFRETKSRGSETANPDFYGHWVLK